MLLRNLTDTVGSTSSDAKWLWASDKIAYVKSSFANCKGLQRFAHGNTISFCKVSELLHSVKGITELKKKKVGLLNSNKKE